MSNPKETKKEPPKELRIDLNTGAPISVPTVQDEDGAFEYVDAAGNSWSSGVTHTFAE
jgi:hypothetical protein